MGAGSVGCFLGGRLALATSSLDVLFVGRERVAQEIAEHGLTVRDFGHPGASVPAGRFAFSSDVATLRECDVILCCVKSAQTASAARSMASAIAGDAIVVSMQNGLGNAPALREHLGERRVLAGIVEFNVVPQGAGVFQRTMSGPLTIEACNAPSWQRVVQAFREGGLAVTESREIVSAQWTKLLVNLNNAISALSGAPTRELLTSPHYRCAVAMVMGEGISVLRKAGIRPAKLRGVPVGWMPRVLTLPTPIVKLVTRAQMKIDPEARSSMWQDLQAGRKTEVDYLNGEIVSLAKKLGAEAPINERVIALVHQAEAAGQGSPHLSGPALLAGIRRRSS